MDWFMILATLTAVFPLSCVAQNNNFLVGTFNAQRLGKKKISNAYVSRIITKIIKRYDILLVTEVQDSKLKHVPKLYNQVLKASGKPYKYVISDRLGRGRYKERYLFFYRSDAFEVADSYHFDDGEEAEGNDLFAREPFIVKFRSRFTDPTEFAVAAIHTPPDEASSELDNLIHVHDDIVNRWKLPHVIIMGDFNADCRYVPDDKLKDIDIYSQDKFHWLVPDDADTTVGKTDCAYDRIVLSGNKLKNSVVPKSAKVFHFNEAFSISLEDANRISDHYPVEFKMKRTPKQRTFPNADL